MERHENGLFPAEGAPMSLIKQSNVRNLLLRALPEDVFNRLQPDMEVAELPLKHSLVEPDQVASHVCFLESGLASTLALSSDNESIEVGHIGREGMSAPHVVLTVDRTPNSTFMQVAGSGIMLPVKILLDACETDASTRSFLLRYTYTSQLQLAHSALANARYNMQERLARWLLMCHDRIDGDDLSLTHEFLSLMLGVRRSGVTNELHIIEGVKAIKATRGNVHVVNRAKLEDIAGGCYGIPEREYERLLGMSSRAG
jgi:CRP-like cAMP-binding protein